MSHDHLHEIIRNLLTERGHSPDVSRDTSLFISGTLDSLAATQVMLVLEGEYGIDLADADFDISQLDTLADLEELVAQAA
ncbi:MAG: phosphopantetheine-binding protein [Pseudomonadota bacterium]